ncbi:MAG: hypothetical protein OXC40_01785 [Proteobacteria bacterium]|nr:hypothetical protein [Pseudomonadota bacterium]
MSIKQKKNLFDLCLFSSRMMTSSIVNQALNRAFVEDCDRYVDRSKSVLEAKEGPIPS